MTARRWCLAWVLIALVCAQALGFMHRVVHAPRADAVAAQAHVHAAADAASLAQVNAPWVGALFAGHDASSCRVFDALGHGIPPLPVALPVLPVLSAGLGLAGSTAEFIDSCLSPFQARGPPAPR